MSYKDLFKTPKPSTPAKTDKTPYGPQEKTDAVDPKVEAGKD